MAECTLLETVTQKKNKKRSVILLIASQGSVQVTTHHRTEEHYAVNSQLDHSMTVLKPPINPPTEQDARHQHLQHLLVRLWLASLDLIGWLLNVRWRSSRMGIQF